MADYLKQFNTTAEYNTYINGTPDLPNVSLTLDNNEVHYNKKPDYSKEYFTLVALANNMTFSWSEGLEYSTDDGQTWTSASSASGISQGTKIKLRGTLTNPKIQYTSNFFNAEGNIMSLLYGSDFIGKTTFPSGANFIEAFKNTNIVSAENLILPATPTSGCYQYMFMYCYSLTTPPALPSTTLAQQCYMSMFYSCTALTTAPELPATTLQQSCYQSMLEGCTALTTAPELPATTLAKYCYNYMFKDCSNLNYIKAMFTTTPSINYTGNWVNGVASNGTFIKNANATWDVTGINGIPDNWTVIDA